MKFAALGRTQFLLSAIEAAVARGHCCVGIATSEPAPEYSAGEDQFAALASKLGVPFRSGRLDVEWCRAMVTAGAEVAISVNWPTLIPKDALSAFHHGIMNAHCGDLPRYRGNACPNWAVLQEEPEVVCTIHRMIEQLDAGPVLIKERLPITSETYIFSIYEWLEHAIPRLFVAALDGLGAGTVLPQPQPSDSALALRVLPRRPEDGLINWRESAQRIAALVRASAEPFAGAFSFLDGQRLTVWRARAEACPQPTLGIPGQVVWRSQESGEVGILSGDGILVLETVDLGGVRQKPAAVLRSTRMRLSDGVQDALLQLTDRVAYLESLLLTRD
jgi:methionyl-tRNA formyltransferase